MPHTLKTSNTCLGVVREYNKKHRKHELIFAGDRRISWGMSHHQIGVRPKIAKRNKVMFAGTGVSYLCDLFCELMNVPEVKDSVDGFTYVHNILYPEAKNILASKDLLDDDGHVLLPDNQIAVILLGVKGELFEMSVSADGITVDAIDAPYAQGCGGHYALGSLKTTERSKMTAENRLKLALAIAAELSPGCDANVDIIREFDD